MTDQQAVIAELLDLESRRCGAISSGDLEALEYLLDDEMTHTHRNGRMQNKAEYLDGLSGNPRDTTREEVQVRLFGDVAVLTGPLVNTFPAKDGESPRVVRNQVLQVWVRRGDSWKEAAFASSPLPESEGQS
jgi:ketosteroid isomerase-like protein